MPGDMLEQLHSKDRAPDRARVDLPPAQSWRAGEYTRVPYWAFRERAVTTIWSHG